MQAKKLPIGYWIKRADQALTKGIDDIQLSFGITRTKWQVLNLISENLVIERFVLADSMKLFADTIEVEEILFEFTNTDLIVERETRISLTSKGYELHKACFAKQTAFRQKSMTDISEQDYETTISTLQKIFSNISESTR